MNDRSERVAWLAGEITEKLADLKPKTSTPSSPKEISDLMFYGVGIYGFCSAVLICLSQKPAVWPVLAPGALGITIGLGLVAVDQFSLRKKLKGLLASVMKP